jgi:putative ABC transport system permease protein
VKAVDPAVYPFYGSVQLDPAIPLAGALRGDQVAVSNDLLLRLGAAVGDSIRLGGLDCRIAAVLRVEPDRMTGTLNVGPRVLLSREAFEHTGLMQPGSRASQRYLFRLEPGGPGIEQLRRTLQKAFPEAQIADFRQTHPTITRGLDRATRFMSLVSLIALIVGALGVATAIRAHLDQRMDSIATMKCLGARSGQIVRIYATQALLLGAAGSLVGVALGGAVQAAFPLLIARYFSLRPGISWDPAPVIQGFTAGILTALLFTLPPLLAIRRVRPNMIFRREMPEVKPEWRARLAGSRISVAAGALLVAGMGAIAAWLSDSAEMGMLFAGGLLVSLGALAAIAWALLRGVRLFLRRAPWRLPVAVRHGLANLYRPGNHAEAVLVALGIGVTFTLTVYLVQHSLLAQLATSAPPGMPNVFLINVTSREEGGLRNLLQKQAGVQEAPELVPAVAARLVSIDGAPVTARPLRGHARHYLRTRQVTWAATLPPYTEILQGAWWKQGGKGIASVSVAEEAARVLAVKPGATLEWEASGRRFASRVAAIHRTESIRPSASIEFIFSEGALDGLPAVYFGALRVRPANVAALQRTVFAKFPAITVINAADVLEIVQEVVNQIALVVRFISAFAIVAGAIILASSVAGTRFRRMREVVVLKTLGATRRRLAAIFSVEFLVLGSVAGLMGSLLATAFSGLLLNRLLDAPLQVDPAPNLIAIVLTAGIAAASGWLASFRILGRKPLEVLREE